VVQPIEQINGKYVVYGLGNFLAKHAPCCDTPQTRDGMILQVTVGPQGDHFVVQTIVYTPTFVDPATMTVLPVPEDLANPSLDPALRQELLDSYQRTVSRVDLLGADTVGVQPDKGH
jgi:hypothetical protein